MNKGTPYEIIRTVRNSQTFNKHEYISLSGVYNAMLKYILHNPISGKTTPFGIIFLVGRKIYKGFERYY